LSEKNRFLWKKTSNCSVVYSEKNSSWNLIFNPYISNLIVLTITVILIITIKNSSKVLKDPKKKIKSSQQSVKNPQKTQKKSSKIVNKPFWNSQKPTYRIFGSYFIHKLSEFASTLPDIQYWKMLSINAPPPPLYNFLFTTINHI
jgi:hypothetical protein